MTDERGTAGTRVRYGRVVAMLGSAAVTALAVAGGLGLLGSVGQPAPAEVASPAAAVVGDSPQPGPERDGAGAASTRPDRASSGPGTAAPEGTDARELRRARLAEEVLPKRSGEGRRAVYSESRQRVWMVGADGRVLHTYPVSGSVYDNLEPGSYEVWSRSRHAIGIEDSGTMQFFVRFARGDTGAAIGFHDIPVDDGRPVQTVDELGTPLSHGCIRQRRADARRMWAFAPIGTTVVVTA